MTIKEKSNLFRSIVTQMADLYEKKNSNYGDSFGQLFEELGPVAGLVPLWNKLHRATSLIKGDENHFESLEDTLKDLACYAIMNLIEMKAEQESKCHSKAKEDYSPDDMNRSGSWGDLKRIWIPEVIDDSININYTTDPCANCVIKPHANNITLVGDSPCQWCNKNPYKVSCNTTTTATTSINGTYPTHILNNRKGETNNEK